MMAFVPSRGTHSWLLGSDGRGTTRCACGSDPWRRRHGQLRGFATRSPNSRASHPKRAVSMVGDEREVVESELFVGGSPLPGGRSSNLGSSSWRSIATVPNLLTIARVLAVPVLGALLTAPTVPNRRAIVTGVFVLAAMTDFLDGFLARRMDLHSEFGAFLDPVADKLMVVTVLVLLSAQVGSLIGIPAAVIVCREIFISALRELMAGLGDRDSVAVGFQGKVKTASQMVALTLLLAVKPFSGTLFLGGVVLLYLSALLTITSAVGYVQCALPKLLA